MSNLLLAELDDFYHAPIPTQISCNNRLQKGASSRMSKQPNSLKTKNDYTVPPNLSSSSSNNKGNAVEVLFDATTMDDEVEEADEEEFGDFETAGADGDVHTNTIKHLPAASPIEKEEQREGQLLDLGFEDGYPVPLAAGVGEMSSPKKSCAERESRFTPHQAIDLLSSAEDSKPPSPPSHGEEYVHQKDLFTQAADADEDWGDFVDSQQGSTKPDASTSNTTLKPPSQSQLTPRTLPTNIPPPSQLLPLFHSPLISPAPTTSTPSIQTTLLVLAHILSGRQLRWKRDSYLSTSHTLTSLTNTHSPNRSKQGLKLHSLTTNEHLHEAREVSEILDVWRQNAGRIRAASAASAVGAGGAGGGVGNVKLPDIREHMVVRKVGLEEGGVKSKRACLLCGLLREERIVGVHGWGESQKGRGGEGVVRVEDSFGEWWVEEKVWIGHVVCREVWEGMRGFLSSR